MSDEPTQTNRRNWDERVAIHLDDRTGIYDVEAFLRGGNALLPLELDEIGDVSGLKIAHLQCHFGIDTLSLARMGAEVTGLDFSASAISAARELARQSGVQANFVEANVYDAAQHLTPAGFDMVYVSWGAIIWLQDIRAWADAVAAVLKPGGRLFLAEGHPTLQQLEEVDGKLVVTYPLDTTLHFREEKTYAGDGQVLHNRDTFEWIHSMGSLFAALTEAGMRVESLREHDSLPWPAVPSMTQGEDRMFRMPEGRPSPPLAFTLTARKA